MTNAKGKPAAAAIKNLLNQSLDSLREIVHVRHAGDARSQMTDAPQAEKGERTAARLGYRSGQYSRTLVTRVSKLELPVPQDRDGRFSTELFECYLPRQHYKHLKSTNMLERLNEEIRRRTYVVRIFPNAAPCCRRRQHEDRLEAHRYLTMEDLKEPKKTTAREAECSSVA